MTDVPSSAVEMEAPGEASAPHASPSVRAPVLWPKRETPGWRYALLRRMLAVADITAVLIATVSLAVLHPESEQVAAWSIVFLPLWVLLAKLLGLYDADRPSLRHLTVDEMPRIILWALIGTSLLSVTLEVTPAGRPLVPSAVTFGFVVAIAATFARAATRRFWRAVTPLERVAVIGSEDVISLLRRKLDLFPDLHFTIEVEIADGQPSPLHVGGDASFNGIDRVIYAPSELVDTWMDLLMNACRTTGTTLNVIPPPGRAFGSGVRLKHLAEVPVLEYSTGDVSRSTLLLKRALDVSVSAVSLVLLLPFLAVIGAAIKLDSPGPVFFTQLRAGKNGRPFRMRKFRSMVQNAEEFLPNLINLDGLAEPVFKLSNDPRITRVGRRLRRWSIDELPQLWNVLIGDMSLVGPRPEQVELVERYTPEERIRLALKPGITGPMQVYGRGELNLAERIAVEREYIGSSSLTTDLRIIALTIGAVVSRRGAA